MSSQQLAHDFDLGALPSLTPEQIYYLFALLSDEITQKHYRAGLVRLFESALSRKARRKAPSKKDVDALRRIAFYVDTHCPDAPPLTVESVRSAIDRVAQLTWTAPLKYSMWVQAFPDPWWTFMNYGFEDPDFRKTPIQALGHERDWILAAQLYHKLASFVAIEGCDVLEVGSGRGGGAAYVARAMRAKSFIAVDATRSNVLFSRSVHVLPGLRYEHAFAEDLPFADGSVDVVINVESINYYRPREKFLKGVKRVLRPGGHFLLAYYDRPHLVLELRERMLAMGFGVVRQEDISAGVRNAMHRFQTIDCDDIIARNATLHRKQSYSDVLHSIWDAAGTIVDRSSSYVAFAFQK